MKKLKSILQCNIFLVLLILVISISLLITKLLKYESKYIGNEKIITGYIKEKYIYDDRVELLIKGKEKVIVYLDKIYNASLNDYVSIKGKFTRPKSNTIFNTFNYKDYLKQEQIYWLFSGEEISIKNKNTNIIYRIKDYIINSINKRKSKDYLNAFILGNKKYISKDIKNIYQNLGIIHLFAVSGMHVSFLLLFLKKIFKKNHLIILMFLFFYLFLVNYQVSILRCFISFLLDIVNKKNNFKINKTNRIYLCASIILIINPLNIYKVGFQLSFIIIYFINFYKDYLTDSIKFSLITFFSSFPIIINNYYSINFLSIFMNLLYIPFISLLVFPLSFITCIFPLFDNLYSFIINIFENSSIFFNSIKYFTISFSKIPIVLVFFYYLFLFLKKKKILIIYILILFFYNSFVLSPRVYYINVNQGDSILIRNKSDNILIDTGGIYNKDIVSNSITFFKSIGIKKLDYLILTHGDFDHMGEAINLVNNFKVEKVIFNCGEYNDLEKELIKVLDKKKIKYYSCIKELNIDKNKLYFLQTKEYDNENDNSNVIYTELNGYKFMFMGDASITTEKEILDKYNLSDIDVLKVGHHGSKTSSGKEFINEINPKYSIISVGKNNRYGHPNKEVLDNLKDSKIYRTDQDGSIMFKIKNNKLRIETFSP